MKRIFRPNFFPIVLAVIFVTSLSSCWENKESAKVELNLSLAWNGEAVSIADTVLYQGTMPIRLEKFQCYIDNISLRDTDGNWITSGSISLVEFTPTSELVSADFDATVMKRGVEVDAIRFGIGVDQFYNLLENAPATFPNEHPLGINGGAGMYWTWESGYIFTKFEGKIASAEGEYFADPFAFHTGTDALYREVILELSDKVCIGAEGLKEFDVVIDLGASIDSTEDELDLINDGITHTLNNFELAERYVNLLDDAWSVSE